MTSLCSMLHSSSLSEPPAGRGRGRGGGCGQAARAGKGAREAVGWGRKQQGPPRINIYVCREGRGKGQAVRCKRQRQLTVHCGGGLAAQRLSQRGRGGRRRRAGRGSRYGANGQRRRGARGAAGGAAAAAVGEEAACRWVRGGGAGAWEGEGEGGERRLGQLSSRQSVCNLHPNAKAASRAPVATARPANGDATSSCPCPALVDTGSCGGAPAPGCCGCGCAGCCSRAAAAAAAARLVAAAGAGAAGASASAAAAASRVAW